MTAVMAVLATIGLVALFGCWRCSICRRRGNPGMEELLTGSHRECWDRKYED